MSRTSQIETELLELTVEPLAVIRKIANGVKLEEEGICG